MTFNGKIHFPGKKEDSILSIESSILRASTRASSRQVLLYYIDYINKALRMSQYDYYEGMSSKRSL